MTIDKKIDVDYKKILISMVAADGGLGSQWLEIEGDTRQGTASMMGSDADKTSHKNVLGGTLASSIQTGDVNFNFQAGNVSAQNRAYLMGGTVTTDPINGKKWVAPSINQDIRRSIMIIGRDNSVQYATNVEIQAYVAKADDDLAYIQVNGLILVPEKVGEEMHGSYDTIDSTLNDIVGFEIDTLTGAATIDDSAHTVTAEVTNGTALTALTAKITTSIGAIITPASLEETDFTDPVEFTVKSADGVDQVWTITVTAAA